MRKILASLESITPMSQGRYHNEPKLDKENYDDYEKRTWRKRMHVNENGNVIIPPFAFKNCLSSAAKRLGMQIPGKGKKTYTKHFESGLLIADPMVLDIKAKDVSETVIFVPSDGMRGGSKRVMKYFPTIYTWAGDLLLYILDDTITKDVFMKHLQEAGNFVGIGSLRVEKNGIWGRFQVVDLVDD
jgi:hypothetical protein